MWVWQLGEFLCEKRMKGWLFRLVSGICVSVVSGWLVGRQVRKGLLYSGVEVSVGGRWLVWMRLRFRFLVSRVLIWFWEFSFMMMILILVWLVWKVCSQFERLLNSVELMKFRCSWFILLVCIFWVRVQVFLVWLSRVWVLLWKVLLVGVRCMFLLLWLKRWVLMLVFSCWMVIDSGGCEMVRCWVVWLQCSLLARVRKQCRWWNFSEWMGLLIGMMNW